MSWSVSAVGTPAEVKTELEKSFALSTATPPAGLDWRSERETVRLIQATMEQVLSTYDPESKVVVNAYGHAGFAKDYEAKTGAYQNVNIQITVTQ